MANRRSRKIIPYSLRSSWPSDQLEDNQSPRCLNVRFRFGTARGTPGRNIISGPPMAEQALSFGRYPTVTGDEWTLLLMQSTLWKWGSAGPATPRSFFNIPPASTAIAPAPRKWSTLTAEDKFFFVNGGEIFRWPDGIDPVTGVYQALIDVPSITGTPPKAKFLEYFNERLIAGWVIDGVDSRPYRIRWPVNANHLDWSGVGSGFLDLLEESQEPITGMRCLSDRLVVYKEHAIIDIVATGILTPIFTQQVRVRGVGTKYPYTIASNGVAHFFLGSDSRVYAWNGIQPIPVSEDIDQELRATIDAANAETYFGICSTDRGEYWLVLSPTDVFVYDYLQASWTRDSFASLISMAEVDEAQTSETWQTIQGTWEQQTKTWDQLQGIQISTLWAGRQDGAVFRIDDAFVDDYFSEGSIIDRNLETPDFYLTDDPMEQATLQRVMVLYDYINAVPFEFGYSFDRGQTWTSFSVIPDQKGYSTVNTNASGHVVRFRFRENNSSGQFRWKSYIYEWLTAGPHLPTVQTSSP